MQARVYSITEHEYSFRFLRDPVVIAMLERMKDGVFLTDSEANVVYMNRRYEEISGLNAQDLLGRNMKDLVDAGVYSVSGTLAVLGSGHSITIEQSFQTGRRAVIHSTPMRDEGSPDDRILFVMTIVQEITELYKVRKKLQALEEQSRVYMNRLEEARPDLEGSLDLKLEVARFEAKHMAAAFERFGNTREAAAHLNMDNSTFVRKRQKYTKMGLM